MVRRTALAPAVAALAAEGARFIREPPQDLAAGELFRRTGALYLTDAASAPALRSFAGAEPWLDPEDVAALVPVCAGGAFAGGVFGPDDGVADVAGLLQAFLKAALHAGARLLTGQRALHVRRRADRIAGVDTDDEAIETRVVVNAAGAWAGQVAALAGASSPPLRSCRRHLFLTAPLDWVDRSWPIVWHLSAGLYFRPEPPGLLLSPCDETEHPAGPVPADPAAAGLLAGKLHGALPDLPDLRLARSWAGLRTLTADGGFVIGRDPHMEGFVWCAGLGGHGVTVSPAAGRLAAEAALGRPAPREHAPVRFAAAAVPARC
jgi:D-arginine dehydrogenase